MGCVQLLQLLQFDAVGRAGHGFANTKALQTQEIQYWFKRVLWDAKCLYSPQRRYPGEIIPGLLYLGDWELAKAFDRLDEINVKR